MCAVSVKSQVENHQRGMLMESSIKFHLLFLVLALKVCFQKTSADSNSVEDILSKYP